MNVIASLQSFVGDDEGQDLAEYAILVALIALIAVVGVASVGDELSEIFARIAAGIPA
jgi:pilus assembly protein Flp/PilA